jgi:hypothetical protein
MAEETYQPSGGDEYALPEEETSNAYANVAEEAPKSNAMGRNIIVLIAIVGIAFGVYKLLGVYTAQKSKRPAKLRTIPKFGQKKTTTKTTTAEKLTLPKATQQTVPQPAALQRAAATATQPAVLQAHQTQALQAANKKLADQLTNLKEHSETTKSSLSEFSGSLGKINNNLSQLDNRLSSLNARLASMQAAIVEQDAKLNNLLAKQRRAAIKRRKRRVPKIPTLPRVRISYHVSAAIPGRAWLKAKNGTTLTVKVGDYVKGYGRIRRINPVTGDVATSSGRMIRFNSQES